MQNGCKIAPHAGPSKQVRQISPSTEVGWGRAFKPLSSGDGKRARGQQGGVEASPAAIQPASARPRLYNQPAVVCPHCCCSLAAPRPLSSSLLLRDVQADALQRAVPHRHIPVAACGTRRRRRIKDGGQAQRSELRWAAFDCPAKSLPPRPAGSRRRPQKSVLQRERRAGRQQRLTVGEHDVAADGHPRLEAHAALDGERGAVEEGGHRGAERLQLVHQPARGGGEGEGERGVEGQSGAVKRRVDGGRGQGS